MLITRIELENIKSYRKVDVDFRRGTTAISGANGAGKTTLVEAIGFALFGYLPYSQEQFVREGEKYGKVIVNLIGSDDRPYTVERRCGSGARWLVFDEEANLRLEQRADVLDRLHDLFGIDRERPLDALFRDALGVPQGTFTAIFLEPPGKRKQTFDALLQIEDYKTAADNLLDTQKHYKELMLQQKLQIEHLVFLTQDLDSWREQLQQARQEDEQQKTQIVVWTRQLQHHEERETLLKERQARVQELYQRHERCLSTQTAARQRLGDREQRLRDARAARQAVEESQAAYQEYLQTQELLQRLRQDAQQRDALRLQQAEQQSSYTRVETLIGTWQDRLAEVAAARQRMHELAPLVEQQIALLLERDETLERVSHYKTIVRDGKKVRKEFDDCQLQLEQCRGKIAAIEPVLPLAECLPELRERHLQLKLQASERSSQQRQWQEKQDALREKKMARDRDAEKLRQAEQEIATCETHRAEAEELPQLQEQQLQLSSRLSRLQGNIEGYARSRAQSAGGQCPLLNESCLNIKQRGIVSLESYFDRLLTREHAEVERVGGEQTAVVTRIGQVRKFADELSRLGILVERRKSLTEQLQRSAIEITRLERDVVALAENLEELKRVDKQLNEIEAAFQESQQAERRVRELDGLQKQAEQLQTQAEQIDARLQELRREVAQYQGSETQLKQLDTQLAALRDPRAQSGTQQHIVDQEEHYQQQLQQEQRKQQEIQQRIQQLAAQLSAYRELDGEIGRQETILQHSQPGYQRYLHHEQEALRLPEREQEYQQQQSLTEQAEQQLQIVAQEYQQARAEFDQSEFDTVQAEIKRLRDDLLVLAQKMQGLQQQIHQLEQRITEGEERQRELDAAQAEYQEMEELHTMTEQFRKLIKEAAPHVLKAMLADISAEANRIFGEVMGDRSAHLSWRNDYEVVLRRQGNDRSFAQLSGGEQMSAALAVRLALLKKLSTLNVAFFDEPTQNMDELRRMNLAEQIRRVRGFDQLIVISHDDTFEQGLDSLIRLTKDQSETHLVVDDDGSAPRVDIALAYE